MKRSAASASFLPALLLAGALLLTITSCKAAQLSYDNPAVLQLLRPVRTIMALQEGAPEPVSATGAGARIVGGAEAARAQFPFQAGVVPVGGVTGFCGGSLVSPRWLLTAALCLFGSQGAVVYLGAYDLSAPDEGLQVLQVGQQALHLNPAFEYATLNNNIALVDLGEGVVKLSEWVQPVPLVLEEPEALEGRVARVAGWGLVQDNGITLSNKLRYAELTLIDNFSCRQYYGLIIVTESTVCADGRGTNGAIATFCVGDIGGPLLLESGQVGVASWVASVSCERGYPSGYERVAPHAARCDQMTKSWPKPQLTSNSVTKYY